MTSQTASPAPRPDNLLGICHALGGTFGFNPLYLRLALMVAMMVNPGATLLAYLAAGMAVLCARLLTRPARSGRGVHGALDA